MDTMVPLRVTRLRIIMVSSHHTGSHSMDNIIHHNSINLHHRNRATIRLSSPLRTAMAPLLREAQVMIPGPSPTVDTPNRRERMPPIMVSMEDNRRVIKTSQRVRAHQVFRAHQVVRADLVRASEDSVPQCLGGRREGSSAIKFKVG